MRSIISSELLLTEVPRAARAIAGLDDETRQRLLGRGRSWIAELTLTAVTREILERAGELEGVHLRTLDAIHVASALSITADVDAFVTYDRRQAEAARAVDLPVASPS